MLPLAHFEFRILLANDVELALTLHNLAILASFLDGCSYFHDFKAIKCYLYLKDIRPLLKS